MHLLGTPQRKLLPAVHGLRALAAISVVLFHLHHLHSLKLPDTLRFVGTHFGLGVQLFFVLSAFSLFYSTSSETARSGWVAEFMIRRYFRIAPLFYCMLGAWTILFVYRGVTMDWSNVLLNILLVFNFVPGKHESIVPAGWTVGVEVLFYVLLPVLLATIYRMRSAIAFASLSIAISLVVREQFEAGGELLQRYAYFSFLSSLASFSFGIVSFQLYNWAISQGGNTKKLISVGSSAYTIVVFVLLATGQFSALSAPVGTLVWCSVFTTLIVSQALSPSWILSTPALVFAGNLSYGIYLTHPMALFFLETVNKTLYTNAEALIGPWSFLVCSALTLTVVISVSVATYLIVERPAMVFGQQIIKYQRQRASINLDL